MSEPNWDDGAEGVVVYPTGSAHADNVLLPPSVVWTSLPLITWILPFIGHTGITSGSGAITDFSGPFTVTVNSFMFGPPRRIWTLENVDPTEYDRAVLCAARVYGKRMHNLIVDNCHSHVAYALNEMRYQGRGDWTMLKVWFAIMAKGRWVSLYSACATLAPFCCLLLIVCGASVASALTR